MCSRVVAIFVLYLYTFNMTRMWQVAKQLRLSILKRHNQAKIIKTSVFLFWILDMAIKCEHVHELRKFLKFCVDYLPPKREIRTKRNLISDMHVQNKNNTGITDKWGFWHT